MCVNGRTVLDVAATSAAAEMKLHRRRAERDAGTTSSREKYANPIGPDPRGPSSASRKAVYRNEYFSIPRPRLDPRTLSTRVLHTRPSPAYSIAIISELIARVRDNLV